MGFQMEGWACFEPPLVVEAGNSREVVVGGVFQVLDSSDP